MPELSIDGRRIDYDAWGEGPETVVFVHGGFGSSSNLWARTASALPAGVRAVAPNLFLRSDPPADGYNVASFAGHVAAFVEALGLAPATFVGHSMGGVVCQLIGARHGHVAKRLGLVCTGPNIRNHGVALSLMDQLVEGGQTRANMTDIARHWFHEIPDLAAFDAYVEDSMAAPLDAMISAQRSLIDMDVEPELPSIRAPTLILHGVKDHGRTMDHAERLKAGIPNSELVLFEKSGHAPMWEEPSAFDRALHGFLQSPVSA